MWITSFLLFYEIPIPSIIGVLILFTGTNQTGNGGNVSTAKNGLLMRSICQLAPTTKVNQQYIRLNAKKKYFKK
jgi:hypothetical protein